MTLVNAKMRLCLLGASTFVAIGVPFPAHAVEYEVHGTIHQTIVDHRRGNQETVSEFTVFVRDCSWLIQTTEQDGKGNVSRREVGATNGSEIVEYTTNFKTAIPLQSQSDKAQTAPVTGPNGPQLGVSQGWNTAVIISNSIPVGRLDNAVAGHLWLMFASQCYWTRVNSNRLTPIYDWHVSVGTNSETKVKAEWNLLAGPGSLPREVRYYNRRNETNGIYTATSTNTTGPTPIPGGFVFEERYIVSNAVLVRKRVVAEVTSVSDKCSRVSLLPVAEGRTVAVDYRLAQQDTGHIPTYTQPKDQGWPSVEQARRLAAANSHRRGTQRPSRIIVGVTIVFLVAPVLFFLPWKRWRMRPQ